MSRKLIWILAIIMTAGLLCLIGVQGYWIRNAVDVERQQFKQVVNKTLTTIIEQLEEMEAMDRIAGEFLPDSLSRNIIISTGTYGHK